MLLLPPCPPALGFFSFSSLPTSSNTGIISCVSWCHFLKKQKNFFRARLKSSALWWSSTFLMQCQEFGGQRTTRIECSSCFLEAAKNSGQNDL
jgi:hypothetical protein